MKISIRYYSGAGNTKYIAKKIAKSFRKNAHYVSNEKISEESNTNGVGEKFDVLGIGFPIYFREAPELVCDLLKRVEGRNRPIFFFTTKGLYSGNAIRNIIDYSIDRNFNPVGSIEFFMPGTDFLICSQRKVQNGFSDPVRKERFSNRESTQADTQQKH